MKLFDFFMYVFYMGMKFQGLPTRPSYSIEVYARNSFCMVFVSLAAIWLSIITFKIEPYRKLLFSAGPPTLGALLGILQVGFISIILIYITKKYYSEDRIIQISKTYDNFLSPRNAFILYFIIFLLHLCVFIFSLVYTASTLANKPIKIG